MGYRLGVDVGGTFTDLLLIDEASGKTVRDRIASTVAAQHYHRDQCDAG